MKYIFIGIWQMVKENGGCFLQVISWVFLMIIF